MKIYKYYFSPNPTPLQINKYTVNFFRALSQKVNVINGKRKPVSRSIDILRYSFSSDVMILNWPEDVVHLRFGVLQMFVSFISLIFFKARGGKIVWICHNKNSHIRNYKFLTFLSRRFYSKFSDFIVVHSEDAHSYFNSEKHKVYFLNHPTYEKVHVVSEKGNNNDDIDVLIWGKINPYKGLSQFIENYRKQKATFKVTIIGNAESNYHKKIQDLAKGLNVTIKNEFLSDKELYKYFSRAKIILLPYLSIDTFSSGALIHSLNSGKIIVGPAHGNFLDLRKWQAILTYEDYSDLFSTISNLLCNAQYYNEQLELLNNGIKAYQSANSWDIFIDNLLQIVGQKNETKLNQYSSEMSHLAKTPS